MFVTAVVLAVLGLIFGSFVNALIWRLHEREETAERGDQKRHTRNLSMLTGRSMCTHCGHELAVRDLVPVFSYLALRGKCRYCGKSIEDTPVAELLTAVIFVVSYLWWPFSLTSRGITVGRVLFIFWLVFMVGFVALTLYDIRWFLLPDRIVYPLVVLALVQVALRAFAFGGGWIAVSEAVWGVLFTAGLFFAIFEVSDGAWIGFGDVKLAVVLGLLVGGPLRSLLLLFIASLLGSLVAIPLLVRGRATARTPLPFGPFLLLATVVVVLFGMHLTNWYENFLFLR